MANYTYEEHKAQQAANRPATSAGNKGPEMHFMGEFLKSDGDIAVVRFPYHSMNDIVYTTTHNMVMPGAPYGRRIRCTGDDSCELCAQGVKVETRVFVKALVYTVNESTNTVVLNNTVWDRPSAFADIDLKGLFDEYGDITNQLFKIKRNGTGTQTRYTIMPIVNTTVYNPAVYKADFSELDQLDAVKILSKSITQYHEALNPGSTKTVEETPVAPTAAPVTETPTAQTYVQQTVVQPTYNTTQEPVRPQTSQNVKYKF